MLIDVSYDAAAGRAVVKHTWKDVIDLFSTVRFVPTRSLEAVGAYALELLRMRYGENLPTDKNALRIAQSCVAARLVRAFEAGGFEGLLLRDERGVVAACFGCPMEEKMCFSEFGTTSIFTVLSPDELSGFFRPVSTFWFTHTHSAPAPLYLAQKVDAERDKKAWRKLAQEVFAKYEAFHANRAKTPFRLDLSFATPVVNFFIDLFECLNEGLNDDESDIDFQFADEAIDLFIVRFGFRQGDMTGALAAVRGVIKRFNENTCCLSCKWRHDAVRVIELAEEYCEAEVERQSFQMELKRSHADAAAFLLLEEEAAEKKLHERQQQKSAALSNAATEPLPKSADELRALVNASDKALQKARAAANKLPKTASKADRQAASARVQSAHTAREAAANALSRAERRDRDRAEREAERARDEKNAAAAARSAAERAERESAEAREEADRLALRLQRAELMAIGGLHDTSTAPVAVTAPIQISAPIRAPVSAPIPVPIPIPIPMSVPIPAPVPAPAATPMRAPVPVPLSVAMTALLAVPPPVPAPGLVPARAGIKLLPAHMRPLPPPPHHVVPWFPHPAPWMYRSPPETPAAAPMMHTPSPWTSIDVIESSETDATCIVCMDGECEVTTTCCSRTFMCAACATRVMRCPLCSSLDFVCLPDELL